MDRYDRILLSLFAWAVAHGADAYPTPVDFDGSVLRWNISEDEGPITYEVASEDQFDMFSFADVIDEAAEMWSGISNSYFRFRKAHDGETAQVTIKLQQTLDNAPFSAGYALFDAHDASNRPRHCTVYIATVGSTFGAIAKTILHELGHCIGLGHSLIPEAIMSYRLEKNSFALDLDDEAAVARLYPSGDGRAALPPGCAVGTIDWSSSESDRTVPLLVLLMSLPIGVIWTKNWQRKPVRSIAAKDRPRR